MNKRKRYGKQEYLVKQKEYIAKKNLWKRETNLKNAKEVVEEYKKEYGRERRKMEEKAGKIHGKTTMWIG